MPKPKRKISLIEAQHRRLDALERWFQFVNDERAITPENFGRDLLLPSIWGLGRRSLTLTGSLTHAEVEAIKMEIADCLKSLADGREWIIPGAELGRLSIVISQIGTHYEGDARSQALVEVAGLLYDHEWRAARCAWCGKLFLKKKRGEYCSLKCSQRMRAKRVRDPRFRSKEKKARQLGMTVLELETAKECSCPKCGAKQLVAPKHPVINCRKCGEPFAAFAAAV